MSYSIRRWQTLSDIMYDDVEYAETAEEAIKKAAELAWLFPPSIIDQKFRDDVMAMEKGDTVRMRKGYIKLTIRVHRNRR